MSYSIDLTRVEPKQIYPLGEKFRGTGPSGEVLGFTNYYMTKDATPFFGISGEIQYARVREEEWEDTILKAKMGGLNIIAFYVFWNVHEEVRGRFRFDGNRNVRKFLELCQSTNCRPLCASDLSATAKCATAACRIGCTECLLRSAATMQGIWTASAGCSGSCTSSLTACITVKVAPSLPPRLKMNICTPAHPGK